MYILLFCYTEGSFNTFLFKPWRIFTSVAFPFESMSDILKEQPPSANFGKHAYLLSCPELDEKIQAPFISVW